MSDVVAAWGLYVAAAPTLSHSATFLYDLVDLTRQALANIAPVFYLKVKEAYRLFDIIWIVKRPLNKENEKCPPAS